MVLGHILEMASLFMVSVQIGIPTVARILVILCQEFRHGNIIVAWQKFRDRDVIVSEELANLSVEELGDRDIVLFQGLGQDSVKELNNCYIVVSEELRHCRI